MDIIHKKTWCVESDKLLEQIRLSSLILYKEHKNNYLYLVNISNKLTLIIIICSFVSAFFNFGLKPYFSEQIIMITCSSITFSSGIVGILQLFYQSQKKMERELHISKELYELSCDIYKTLSINHSLRHYDAQEYINNKMNKYQNIIEMIDNPKNNVYEKILPDTFILLEQSKPQIEQPQIEQPQIDIENHT
jgi:hypothetical protein